MTNDRRPLLAVLLCVLFYLGYSHYLGQKYPPIPQESESLINATPGQAESRVGGADNSGKPQDGTAVAAPAQAVEVVPLPPDQLVISSDVTEYQFDQSIGGLRQVTLKNYREKAGQKSSVKLLESPLQMTGVLGSKVSESAFSGYAAAREGRTIRFWRDQGQWRISQVYEIPEVGYGLKYRVDYQNLAPTAQGLIMGLQIAEHAKVDREAAGSFLPGTPTGLLNFIESQQEKISRVEAKTFCEKGEATGTAGVNASLDFIGFDQHYFLKVLLPETKQLSYQYFQNGGLKDLHCHIGILLSQDYGEVKPNESGSLGFRLYFGPKDLHELGTFGGEVLKNTVDYGMFSVLAKPLLWALQLMFSLTANYGLAIILVTLFLKIVFYPLTRQAAVSMHKMKKLQPEMNRIKEKYSDDKQVQQRELMKFMVENKLNPMKGCLPMLPQIPVFFAYYQVLLNSIALRQAPFFGWIRDLSEMDPWFVTPLLLGAGMFLQQRLTPTTGMDKNQERILMFMPIMFTLLMLTLPAGMVIYMLTNTVISIAQQQWLNKKLA